MLEGLDQGTKENLSKVDDKSGEQVVKMYIKKSILKIEISFVLL